MRRKLISVAAVSAALVAGMTTTVAVAQAPAEKTAPAADTAPALAGPAEAEPSVPAERLIVGCKSVATEAKSNRAATPQASGRPMRAGTGGR